MDMKVKSAFIRKLRSARLWSQEQLAEACGIGLRTIQRLERTGNASAETVRALAAVLEVHPDELLSNKNNSEIYRHTQRGDYILLVLSTLAIVVLTLQTAYSHLPPWVLVPIFASLIIPAVLFYSMTIEVNEHEVAWYFGPGFWHKTVALEEIAECRAVENPLWWGFGIRTFGTGWLYNVSGLLGVELCLKSGAKVRLGTDEPNYLVEAINDAKMKIR
jgi:transcriptional regulator with XRE-family HTH domain